MLGTFVTHSHPGLSSKRDSSQEKAVRNLSKVSLCAKRLFTPLLVEILPGSSHCKALEFRSQHNTN